MMMPAMMMPGGSCCVLVRGFDFGTTEDQLTGHMASVGNIVSIVWLDSGSAEVTYSSPYEAGTAVQQLQATTIWGNKRFIDVLPKKGDGVQTASLFSSGGKGGSCGGMPASAFGNPRVFVRGFDFGTTEVQLRGHMSRVGHIMDITFIDQGSAEVTYSAAYEASAAVQQLQATTIYGNTRFIDVLPAGGGSRPATPFVSGGKGGGGGTMMPVGHGCVLVRGFDFGTTADQLMRHMSSVGNIVNISFRDKGSADVAYSSAYEASAAVQQLQGTTIYGNARFIDVLPEGNGKGGCGGGIPQSFAGYLGPNGDSCGKGCRGGKSGHTGFDHKGTDPAGSGRVFVRGFDFGTDVTQVEEHMSAAGAVHEVFFETGGSASVVYSKRADANRAVSLLNQTTINGNSRYIDVILKDG